LTLWIFCRNFVPAKGKSDQTEAERQHTEQSETQNPSGSGVFTTPDPLPDDTNTDSNRPNGKATPNKRTPVPKSEKAKSVFLAISSCFWFLVFVVL